MPRLRPGWRIAPGSKTWVTQSRPGLPNHAMAEATYRNIVLAGAPQWDGEAIRLAQEIQKELGLAPMDKPYLGACETTIPPMEAEMKLRHDLPPSQLNSTSDDYTEYLLALPDGAVLHRPADAEGAERLQLSGLGDERAGRPHALHRPDDPHGGQDHRRDHHGPDVQRRAAEERAGRVEASAPAAASAARTGSRRCCPRISACRSTSAGRNT